MNGPHGQGIGWVVLTQGARPRALESAVGSIRSEFEASPIVVVANGCEPFDMGDDRTEVVVAPADLGVPEGRNFGARALGTSLVGFLDDDAELRGHASPQIAEAFDSDDRLAAVSLRLVDESGASSPRHVPRPRGVGAEHAGEVALFLGGASVLRAEALASVGYYYGDLRYGHEEVELSWRLIDAGWAIRYLADVLVFHPRTEISRHPDGWRLTGRNRVLIARRTLPWPVAAMHVTLWLMLGAVRAARQKCLRPYLSGWISGWRHPVDRQPISWRGVWRLTRLGRPPII